VAEITDRVSIGNALQALMIAADITPGDSASYELCKQIYLYHPHGSKIVDKPLALAISKPRKLSVPGSPDDGTDLIEAFEKQWDNDDCTEHLLNVGRLARIYGIASLGVVQKDVAPDEALDTAGLAQATMSYNEWDPLNTSGSLVFNQDPNALDFQKNSGVRVNGVTYDRTRVVVLQHENPIYIAYESSGYGFTGRSSFQRSLLPLKQFVQLMSANGMVALKAGVLIAKIQSPSSAVDRPMLGFLRQKRQMVKEAENGNVLSISPDEDIESLNLQNLEGPLELVRRNIIEDIAAGAGMPAKLLLEDTFAVGFGEGTEDSKAIVQYLNGMREWLAPAFTFLDRLTMHRAWNEEFYTALQDKYPEQYGQVPYAVAFAEWQNNFLAEWPNLLEETDEQKATAEKVTLEAVVSVFEILAPQLPGSEIAKLVDWVANNLNAKTHLFASPLELDIMAIADFADEKAEQAKQVAASGMGAMGGGLGDNDTGQDEEETPRSPKVVRLPSL
jgi:hypothetical protein